MVGKRWERGANDGVVANKRAVVRFKNGVEVGLFFRKEGFVDTWSRPDPALVLISEVGGSNFAADLIGKKERRESVGKTCMPSLCYMHSV